MSNVKHSVNEMISILDVLDKYIKDPELTVSNEISGSDHNSQIIPEDVARNLLEGLRGDITKEYAVGLGKRRILAAFTDRLDMLENNYKNRTEELKKFCKELTSGSKVLDEQYNNGVIESRWMSLKNSSLYRDYFIERLDRDFLPTLNGITYGLSVPLNMEKVILVYRVFLSALLEKNYVNDLTEANLKVNEMLSMFEDVKNIEVILNNSEIEEMKSSIEEMYNFKFKIFTKKEIGNLLQVAATTIDDLDNTRVSVLEGLESLKELLDKGYNKLDTDINTLNNVLNSSYNQMITSFIPRLKEYSIKLANDYIEYKLTDVEFKNKMINIVNCFIRIHDIDAYMRSQLKKSLTEIGNDLSSFIGLTHLYFEITTYSLSPGKKPTVK